MTFYKNAKSKAEISHQRLKHHNDMQNDNAGSDIQIKNKVIGEIHDCGNVDTADI